MQNTPHFSDQTVKLVIEAFDEKTEFELTENLQQFFKSTEFQQLLTNASIDLRKYVLDFLCKKFTKIHLHSTQLLLND